MSSDFSEFITNLCRACLSPANLRYNLNDFVKIDDDNVQIRDLLQLFSNIQFSDACYEQIPTQICEQCLDVLQKSRVFLNTVRRSDERLKRICKREKSKSKVEPANSKFGQPKRTYTKKKKLHFSDNYLSTKPKEIRILPKLDTVTPAKFSPAYAVGQNLESKEAAFKNPFFFLPKNEIVGVSLPTVLQVPSKFNNFAGSNVTRINLEESVTCSKCSKKFVNEMFLKCHSVEEHKSPEREYQCEICELHFNAIPELQLHNLTVHLATPKEFCPLCKLYCKDVDALAHHSKKFHPERRKRRTPKTKTEGQAEQPATRVTCELCGRTFKNESWLALHKDRNHNNNICPRCNLCFSNEANLMTHSATHIVSKLYSCILCGKDFSTRTYLTHHRRMVHKENAELYYCGECGDNVTAYTDFDLLRTHLSEHGSILPQDSSQTSISQEEIIETETTYYTVVEGVEGEELVEISPEAVEQFLNEGIKPEEGKQEISDPLPLELSSDEMKTESLADNTKAVENGGDCTMMRDLQSHFVSCSKIHQCVQCGIIMSRKYNLKRHMAIAHRLPTLDCSTCGDVFNSTAKLAAHKAIHASDTISRPTRKVGNELAKSANPKSKRKQWSCQICEHRFGLWSQLYMHTWKDHGQDHADKLKAERFLCKICGKQLSTRAGFTYHMWKHAEMRPHRCSECGRRFMSRSALGKHLLTRHGNDKPHLCQHCGKGFSNKDHLKKHLVFTHGGRRDYLCGVCGRTFLQSSHAKQHMWRHTGVKPMTCKYCAAGYTTGAGLKKHIIRNHPEEHRQQSIDEEQKYRLLEGTNLNEIVDIVTEGTVKSVPTGRRTLENMQKSTAETFVDC